MLKNITGILFVIIFFTVPVFAHEAEEHGTEGETMRLYGYLISVLRPEAIYVNEEAELAIQVDNPEGKFAKGMDVQGQIMDPATSKDLFYAAADEPYPGEYSFKWMPSFAGEYYVQFIFRAEDDQIVKPTFAVHVEDKRAKYAWAGGIIVALLAVIIGIYESLPLKKKKFSIKPILVGVGIGALLFFLGYSVSSYYEVGGERGFVVCGPEGCDLALHWHSQLHMTVCGEAYNLPLEAGDLDEIHTHKERDYLHFHSLIKTDEAGTEILEPEKLAIGNIFNQLDIRFTDECFADYCNGDKCPDGKPGTLSMIVNNIPNDKFADYSYKDGDEIRITFG